MRDRYISPCGRTNQLVMDIRSVLAMVSGHLLFIKARVIYHRVFTLLARRVSSCLVKVFLTRYRIFVVA